MKLRKQPALWTVLALILWTASTACASDSLDCIRELLKMHPPEAEASGNTASLAGVLSFTVPGDWEEIDTEEGEDVCFAYR